MKNEKLRLNVVVELEYILSSLRFGPSSRSGACLVLVVFWSSTLSLDSTTGRLGARI